MFYCFILVSLKLCLAHSALIFSSTEPKAHGELIAYQSSRRLCVCQCVCPFISLRPVDRLQPNFI